jgi:hypothetical protein
MGNRTDKKAMKKYRFQFEVGFDPKHQDIIPALKKVIESSVRAMQPLRVPGQVQPFTLQVIDLGVVDDETEVPE